MSKFYELEGNQTRLRLSERKRTRYLYNREMADKVIEVAPVGTRKYVPHEAIMQLVQQIVSEFHPQKVILFGSHAYGKPHTASDVDLLVVMETELTGAQQAVKVLHKIDLKFGVDLIVYTPQRLAQRLEWGDSFLKEIVAKGRVLYESPDA